MRRLRPQNRVQEPPSTFDPMLLTLVLFHLYLVAAAATGEATRMTTDRLLSYTIEEESPRGTIVISNLRRDSGLSTKYRPEVVASLRFVFLDKNQRHLDLFSLVDHSGVLSTAGMVDREIVCRDLRPRTDDCVIQLDIAVQPPAYFEVIKVKVVVKDINDNQPAFPVARVEKQLPESTPFPLELFPIAAATDADSPTNGVTEYKLMTDSADDKFSLRIDRSLATGELELKLVLTGSMDREERDKYTLNVVAYDGGTPRHSAMTTIVIQVTDVNDNSPTFTSAPDKVTLPENLTPGSKVVLFQAADPDLGPNGRVQYKISKKTELIYPGTFSMDPSTGQVTLSGPLDRERISSYKLFIVAEDFGENPLPTQATVSITVLDINDNKPEIIVDHMTDRTRLEIREHAKPRSFVAHVLVTDPDEGDNGRVQCVLTSGHDNLILESPFEKEFRLLTARSFDREVEQMVSATLCCHDLGRPIALTSTQEISVWVADLDDHVPQFTHPVYYASLAENNLAPVDILNVSVVDADPAESDPHFIYVLDDRAKDWFDVGRHSGLIRAMRVFDREEVDCAEFGVSATDDVGSFHASAVVRVHIVDVDDESPAFNDTLPYSFDVAEDAPSRTEVGRVEACDRDLWPHNQTWYELDPETSYGDFEMDPLTGTIYTNGRLDREVRDRYIMTAVAQSRGSLVMRSDSVFVFVRVLDCNDNAPVILHPTGANDTIIKVPTNLAAGGLVTSIVAYDSDVGSNGLLRYSLAVESEFFSVAPETGKVFLRRTPPENSSHLLAVVVADGGHPSLSSSAMMSLLVTDQWASTEGAQQAVVDGSGGSVFGGSMLVLAGVVAGCVAAASLLALALLFIWQRFGGGRGKYPTSSSSSSRRNRKSELMWSIVRSVSQETSSGTLQNKTGLQEEAGQQSGVSTSTSIQKLDYEPGRQRWNPVFDADSGLDVMTTSVTSHGSSSIDECESANSRRPAKSILSGPANPDSRYMNSSAAAEDDFAFPPPPNSLLFQNPPSDVSTFRPISMPRSCSVDHSCSARSTAPPVVSRHSCISPPLPIPTCPTMFLQTTAWASAGDPLPSSGQVRYPQQGSMPRSTSYGSRKSVRFADEDI